MKKGKDQIALPLYEEKRKGVVDIMQIIYAPWTEHQVENLNIFQTLDSVHPFTCFSCHRISLIATTNGWICPACNYTQDWAHAIMMDEEFIFRAKNWKRKLESTQIKEW